MTKCGNCGGRLYRVHRTFFQKFSYMAVYRCGECGQEEFSPRRYRYHLGPDCRCPRCGSLRVVRLKERDHIDPLEKGLLSFLERLAGGTLHHCRYCRLQFYDRRPVAPEAPAERRRAAAASAGALPLKPPPDTASSGV
ncbi:MAG TPA: hypothetical protein VF767_06235 [Bryobacteraceae bacterium]